MTTRKKDKVLSALRRVKGWAQVARDIAVIIATIVTIVVQAINVVRGGPALQPQAQGAVQVEQTTQTP